MVLFCSLFFINAKRYNTDNIINIGTEHVICDVIKQQNTN